MRLFAALLLLSFAVFASAGCAAEQTDSNKKATGTPTDPVDVCERLADVCRYKGAKLGVCIESPADKRPPSCSEGQPCYVCMSQH